MKRNIVCCIFVIFLLVILTSAYANRFSHNDEIGIEDALNIAVDLMHSLGDYNVGYINDHFCYNALLSDEYETPYWIISLIPIEDNVRHLIFEIIIDANDGGIVWHTSNRYFFHYELALQNKPFHDHFVSVLSAQEQKHGPIERWNYLQYAETEEIAHGWMYTGVFERFLVPNNEDLSYEDACRILLSSFDGAGEELVIISSRFEVYHNWPHENRYWCFFLSVDNQITYVEIDSITSTIIRKQVSP